MLRNIPLKRSRVIVWFLLEIAVIDSQSCQSLLVHDTYPVRPRPSVKPTGWHLRNSQKQFAPFVEADLPVCVQGTAG